MLLAHNYDSIIETLHDRFRHDYPAGALPRMVGLLFAKASGKFWKEQILPSLQYFWHRSENQIDFFIMGYSGFDADRQFELEDTGTYSNGARLYYSDKDFVTALNEFESRTSWRYSGEADLLLVMAIPNGEQQPSLDFSSVIVLDLHEMVNDKSIPTVSKFFEEIFEFARTNPFETTTKAFSNKQGVQVLRTAGQESLIEWLPKAGGKVWTEGRHYKTMNLKP